MHPSAARTYFLTAFLSSTGADLRTYREAAFLAIRKLDGWKCIRMEDFGARDWDVDSYCRARAEECDLFVGIVGHRFGDGPKGRVIRGGAWIDYDLSLRVSCRNWVQPDGRNDGLGFRCVRDLPTV